MITRFRHRTARAAVRQRLWRETVTAMRFGLVGLAATATHIAIVAALLALTDWPALAANTLAFCVAFGVSFLGNYHWTFHAPGDPHRAMRRFLAISLGGFVVNTMILATVLQAGWLPPFLAAIVSASAVPAITFVLSRVWGFRSAPFVNSSQPGGVRAGATDRG